MTHGVEGGVAGLGGGGGVCLRAGSGLRVSVFGGERETRRDFGVHYTPLVLVRDDLMRDLGSLTDNSVSCLRFSTFWLVYSLSLAVPCYALNFFQKPCSTTVSIEYSQWTGETHRRSQVVLCVVGRHGLWLGRIGSISEEGGGANHGVWGSDWSAALCQSSVELSCGHLPAANHRAPISTATLRHYRGYAIYVKRICSRDCFLCDLHHGVDDRRINLFLGVQVTTLLPLSFLPSFLPQRILPPSRQWQT